jgi:hypothetical protein
MWNNHDGSDLPEQARPVFLCVQVSRTDQAGSCPVKPQIGLFYTPVMLEVGGLPFWSIYVI